MTRRTIGIDKETVKIRIINWSKDENDVRKYVRDGDEQPSENRESRHARIPLTTVSREGMIL